MSLSYDLISARDMYSELQIECETLGIEFLSALISALGKDNWEKCLLDYRAEIFAYIRSTPSQRKRKARWKEDKMRGVLALASLLYMERIVEYLEIAVALEGIYSNTVREGLAKIAEVVAEREGKPRRLWPFASHKPFS